MNLLQLLYQNAYIGSETLRILLSESKDESFCHSLARQRLEYLSAANAAADLLAESAILPEQPAFLRFSLFSVLLRTHQNTSSLAQLLTQGCTDGILEIRQGLNHMPMQDQRILRLAEQLIFLEESTIFLMGHYV